MAEKVNMKIFSSKQEKMIANELGGYQVGMSGAAPTNPGDVKTYDWLVECKTHSQLDQSIFFDLSVWKKIENEAMAMHRKPVLIVDDGSQERSKTWCLCRANNLNLTATITLDFPAIIRKNVICKHEKLMEALKSGIKGYVGEFYEGGVFELKWNEEDVVVLPLATFKELFEK